VKVCLPLDSKGVEKPSFRWGQKNKNTEKREKVQVGEARNTLNTLQKFAVHEAAGVAESKKARIRKKKNVGSIFAHSSTRKKKGMTGRKKVPKN